MKTGAVILCDRCLDLFDARTPATSMQGPIALCDDCAADLDDDAQTPPIPG